MTVTYWSGSPAEAANNSVFTLSKRSTGYSPTYFATTAQSTLQAGHGWTATNNAAGDLNYTGEFYQGSQCVKMTTTGGGGSTTPTYVTSPRVTAVDLRAQMLRFWIKCDAATFANLSLIRIYLGSGASAFASFATSLVARPYDDGYFSLIRSGEWIGFTINPSSLPEWTGTPDFSAVRDIRVRIEDKGVGGQAATVYLGGVEMIANDAAYSAHGVISLTFDDGYASCLTDAAPTMAGFGYEGTAYIIRNMLGSGGYLTTGQLATLRDTYNWDVQVHADTVSNHNLTDGFVGIGSTAVGKELSDEINYLVGQGHKHRYNWAMPRGMTDNTVIGQSARFFQSARGTQYRTLETLPVCQPHNLRSIVCGNTTVTAPNTTPASLEWYVDKVYDTGGWLILSFHQLINPATTGVQYLPSDFSALLTYINGKGVPVVRLDKVLGVPTMIYP